MRPAVIWLDFLLCFGVCAIVEWGWFPLFFIIQINIFLLNSPPSLFSVLMVNTNLKETEKALFCSSFFFFFLSVQIVWYQLLINPWFFSKMLSLCVKKKKINYNYSLTHSTLASIPVSLSLSTVLFEAQHLKCANKETGPD